MNRVLLDQGLPCSTALLLRERGWDVLHVGEVGMSSAPDSAILRYARNESRVVVTLDADFHALLAISGASTPSTIRIRIEGLKATDLVPLLETVWQGAGQALQQGAMVTVTEASIRIKLLPV